MDPEKITKLAKLLKAEGDKVLNSEYKLTLSGSLLRALNDSFTLIVDTADSVSPFGFRVVKPNNAKSDVFRDLQFIYDFVQKTIILCLTQFDDDDDDEGHLIDINKFVNIRTLELRRIAVTKLVGLQQFRPHLQQLICVRRSLESPQDVIILCGGDKTGGFIWNNLSLVDFSYNCLKQVDDSFEFAPYLETLNLSHNKLKDVGNALRWLPNLKTIDLSYNELSKIPIFHQDANRRLRILRLACNFIEDISDVTPFQALIELDLSENCLMGHSTLLPLATLVTLQDLSLRDNPLACHPKHRQESTRYLNKNTRTVKFILDGEPLSRSEKTHAGNYDYYHPLLKSMSSTDQLGLVRSSGYDTPKGSVDSLSTADTRSILHDDMSSSFTSSYRRVKSRVPVIEDEKDDELHPPVLDKRQSFEQSKEHLEIKYQIMHLREQYGADWLLNQEDPDDFAVKLGATSKRRMTREFIESLLNSEVNSSQISMEKKFEENVKASSTPLLDENISIIEFETANNTLDSKYQTALDTNLLDSSEPTSDPEDDEVIYAVTNQVTNEEVLLIITERHIRERNTLTGCTLTKWGIRTLESCERTQSEVITLQFDTIRKDRKRRDYKIDKHDSQKLESLLRDILSNRPLSEMNQKLYRCAVCRAQFSREQKLHTREATCPECKSSYVMEITDLPKKYLPDPKMRDPQQTGAGTVTGSAGSANDSSSCSKISKSESSFDSNVSIAGSAVSDRDCDFYGNESDIEVLSNPSQSSIEVLDGQTSSRKHSEERKTDDSILARSVEATTQTNLPSKHLRSAQQLTESSSSGSVTDSICTTYEQPVTDVLKEDTSSKENDRWESIKPKVDVIGTMLEILKFGSKTKVEESEANAYFEPYTYSYSDFRIVDHRLKLFLYQHIFEDDGEMKWIVKGRVYDENTTDSHLVGFSGIFVMSTTKFYFLRAVKEECEEPSAWLKRFLSGTVDRIITVRVLPFKIGITFTIKEIGNVHLLLQDILRTDSLLLFFADHSLPSSCSLEYRVSEDLIQKLAAMTQQEKIRILSLLNKVTISSKSSQTIDFAAFVVTDNRLLITTSNFKWLCATETEIPIAYTQLMSNVVEADEGNGIPNSFRLHFMDETVEECGEETWQLDFDTLDSCESAFDTISQCWEKLLVFPFLK